MGASGVAISATSLPHDCACVPKETPGAVGCSPCATFPGSRHLDFPRHLQREIRINNYRLGYGCFRAPDIRHLSSFGRLLAESKKSREPPAVARARSFRSLDIWIPRKIWRGRSKLITTGSSVGASGLPISATPRLSGFCLRRARDPGSRRPSPARDLSRVRAFGSHYPAQR